jgi:NAD(P)-dependent dehydrogenase (short-subunit alcohol dehydrogenase family)
MRFEDKVVIVTGAAGGIGRAISARFATEGATVIVTDMNGEGAEATVAQIVNDGGKARAFASDISNAEGCRAIIENVIATDGRIDVLCNNAGINRRGNLLSLTPEDWRLSFAVNVDSMFHLCQAALPHMIEAGGGAIVNTASQWGLCPAPNHIAYNVTKAAVASFTQTLHATTHRTKSASTPCAPAKFTRQCWRPGSSDPAAPSRTSTSSFHSAGLESRRKWPLLSPFSPRTRPPSCAARSSR